MITRNDLENDEQTLELKGFIDDSREKSILKIIGSPSVRPIIKQNATNTCEKITHFPIHTELLQNYTDTRFDCSSIKRESNLNYSMDQILIDHRTTSNRAPRTISDNLYLNDFAEDDNDRSCNITEDSLFCNRSPLCSTANVDDDIENIYFRLKGGHSFSTEYLSKGDSNREKLQYDCYNSEASFNHSSGNAPMSPIKWNVGRNWTNSPKTMVEKNDYYNSSQSTTDCSSMDVECSEELFINDLPEREQRHAYCRDSETTRSDNKKGKISSMQRIALASIFTIVDRPSRGLVLHIALELNLHHVTVKNFFSNGRRRLRRAAARLNYPERTKRENERRKEKRKLAAIAAAAYKDKNVVTDCEKIIEGTPSPQKEQLTLSPARKILMEKLAVKIQKSVAQKAMVPIFSEDGYSESQQKSLNCREDLAIASCKIFSLTKHSNYSKPFHLFDNSQNDENKINKLHHGCSPNEVKLRDYTQVCQDNFYSSEAIGKEGVQIPAIHRNYYSPTNW